MDRRKVDDSRWLQVLLPHHCLACGLPSVTTVCAGCHGDLPWSTSACVQCALPIPAGGGLRCAACQQHPPHFDAAIAPWRFADPLPAWLHHLKQQPRIPALPMMAKAIAEARRAQQAALPQVIVPVPQTRWRSFRRGYNQAELIAQLLAQHLGLPLRAHAAKRLHDDGQQRGKTRAQRQKAMRDAFVCDAKAIAGWDIAIVDDVMTTGATLDALARAAKAAGAARVEAWVIARVE